MTRRFVVHTGPLDKAPAWIEALRAEGIDAAALPTVRVEDVPPTPETDALVAAKAPYAFTVLTSRRAAYVLPRWKRHLAFAPLAVVGSETAYGAASYGFDAAIVGTSGADELAHRILNERPMAGASVLWPCGEAPMPTLKNRLEAAGATVVAPIVYRTVREAIDPRRLRRLLRDASGLVFTSPSGVQAFADAADAAGEGPAARRLVAACLGASTAEAARAAGFLLPRAAARPEPAAVADVFLGRSSHERT